MSQDIDALAALSITEVREAAEELAKLKGWNINSAAGLLRCLPMLVKKAEALGAIRGLTGSEKQSFVVAIFLRLVKLPWWLPASFVRPLLEAAVDAIVEAINSKIK